MHIVLNQAQCHPRAPPARTACTGPETRHHFLRLASEMLCSSCLRAFATSFPKLERADFRPPLKFKTVPSVKCWNTGLTSEASSLAFCEDSTAKRLKAGLSRRVFLIA